MKSSQCILALFACSASTLYIKDHVRRQQPCRPVTGTFMVNATNLFPESADWDPVHCKLYAGALYNSSAISYDPYTGEIEHITFPNISGNDVYHVAGVDYDGSSGSMYFAANAGAGWNFSALGKNMGGPNNLIKYNTNTGLIDWYADMSVFQEQVMAESGHIVAGFQDMAEDPQGNSYMIASFGDAIAKVSADGQNISVFYNSAAQNTSVLGIGALFTVGNTLVVSQSRSFDFLIFDTLAPDGTLPQVVKSNGQPSNLHQTWCDSLIAPSKYNGSVALCAIDSMDTTGGVAVFQSRDGWQSIDYKGHIERNSSMTTNSTPTATVAIGNSIYIVEEFFQSTMEPMEPKNSFPFVDITFAVERLLR